MEVFKDVPNYEGIYQISNFGKVKSVSRTIKNNKGFYLSKEIILKSARSKNNYYSVVLRKENVSKTYRIHVLVAMAFLDFIPNKFECVIDHKNGVRTDNRLENLQIVTQRENIQNYHKSRKGQIGADWHEQTKKWRSRIYINKRIVHLGLFEEEKDALKAYEIANKEIENFENTKQFRTLIKQKIKHYDKAKY